jgi:SAM-dependent methyltransferase
MSMVWNLFRRLRPLSPPNASVGEASGQGGASVSEPSSAAGSAPVLDNSGRMYRNIRIVADLARRPLSECRVADLGCAHGYYAVELARRGAKSMGIEGRASWVQHARASMDRVGLGNGQIFQDDVRNFSKQKYGSFDIVLCLGLLYHLDNPALFELIANIADCCSDFAVIDTQIAMKPMQSAVWRQKEYWGWAYREHADNADVASKEANLGASLDNNFSFWLTRASLLNALQEVGFTSVYECANPLDAMHLDGKLKLHSDYITLVAVKGAPKLEAAESVQPKDFWPEDPGAFYLPRPYVAPWS